jgi:hypothetical protein
MTASSTVLASAFLLASAPIALAQNINDERLLSAAQAGAAKLAGAPAPTSTKFAVDGLALGGQVKSDSGAYRAYQCGASQQFDAFTWCQKTGNEREGSRSIGTTHSMLHGQDGRVVYVSRYQSPAFFTRKGADEEIARYSRQFGEQPRLTKLPQRGGAADGLIALWGKISLEPLDRDSLKLVAEGKSPKKGFLVDHIGNFARSAKEGLPVYRITGGPGFFWAASLDRAGRGTLRFAAVDASALASPVPEQAPNVLSSAPEPNNPIELNQPKLASADSTGSVSPPVREQIEAKPEPKAQAQAQPQARTDIAAAEPAVAPAKAAEGLDDLMLAQNDPLKLTPEVKNSGQGGNTIVGLIALFTIVAVWHLMKSRRAARDDNERRDAEPEVSLSNLPTALSGSVVPDNVTQNVAQSDVARSEQAKPSKPLDEGELVNHLAQTLGVNESGGSLAHVANAAPVAAAPQTAASS